MIVRIIENFIVIIKIFLEDVCQHQIYFILHNLTPDQFQNERVFIFL